MKQLTLTLSVFIACCAILTGCQKGNEGPMGLTGPAGSTGPTGPVLKGNVIGDVALFDEYGSRVYTNLKGVNVSIDGTTSSTSCDSLGKWEFDNLNTGVYNISLSTNGYGGTKIQSLEFSGGQTGAAGTPALSSIPDFSVSTLFVKDSTFTQPNNVTNSYVKITGTVSMQNINAAKNRTVLFFIGKDKSVSSAPANFVYTASSTFRYSPASNPTGQNFTFNISADDLHNAGFSPNSRVYIAAYGAANNYNSSSRYLDYSTGRFVFNAISATADTASVLVP